MPIGCAAVGCTNNQMKNKELSFYRFPAEQDRRDKWTAAVKRADSNSDRCQKEWKPSKYSRICSAHFVSGLYFHFCRCMVLVFIFYVNRPTYFEIVLTNVNVSFIFAGGGGDGGVSHRNRGVFVALCCV